MSSNSMAASSFTIILAEFALMFDSNLEISKSSLLHLSSMKADWVTLWFCTFFFFLQLYLEVVSFNSKINILCYLFVLVQVIPLGRYLCFRRF